MDSCALHAGSGAGSDPLLREIVNEFLDLFPSEAGICDGFSVNVLMLVLAAVEYVGLNHESLDKTVNRIRKFPAVADILRDADLFIVLFAGVVVIGIDDDRRVLELLFFVQPVDQFEIFVVVVRMAVAELVDVAS